MPEEQQAGQTQTEAQPNSQPAAATPAEAQKPDNQSQEQTVPYARFKEVNDKLKALEDAAKQAAANQQAAEEQRMQEQQQWRELAEERGKQLQGYKDKATDYDKLAALVGKQLETEINGWPEKVRNLFPAGEMPVLAKLEWAERFRPLAQEMAGEAAPTPGNGRRPAPVVPAGQQQHEQKTRASHERWARGQF